MSLAALFIFIHLYVVHTYQKIINCCMCVQLLQAKMKGGPFNLEQPVDI